MQKSMLKSFPHYNLNLDPIQSSFSEIGKAIDVRNYGRAIDLATDTIDEIQRTLLYTAFLQRAHAFAMKSNFEEAIRDAEKAILLDETSAVGYLWLGEFYSMQGKQSRAIQTFRAGLKNGVLDDRESSFLMYCKLRAEASQTYMRDPVSVLPNELVELIMAQLPQEAKCICLGVSRTWRKAILNSPMAWTTLTMVNQSDSKQVTGILPHIAAYVEQLNMDTESKQIWPRCLLSMGNGDFKKLHRLCLTVNGPWQALTTIATAFGHTRSSLTSLEVNLCTGQTGIGLADILSTFHNLKCLTYTVDLEGAQPGFFGDFAHLTAHNVLADLHVKMHHIDTEDIELLLQRCQQLRRLVLHGKTHDGVLDVINRSCPNLQILGYKSDSAITELDDLDVSDGKPGLRQIYTHGGGFGVSPLHLLPLIRKNMQTLKTLYLNFNMSVQQMANDGPYFDNSERRYDDLKLDNLEYLLYFTDPNYAVDSVILRSISTCRSLRFFGTVGSPNVEAITTTLMTLPPVKQLELSHTEEVESADTSLLRLFDYYTSHSEDTNVQQTICLQNSKSVNDAVLDAVARIESVKRIALWSLDNISANGLHIFLERIRERISYINLSDLGINVTNDHIITLSSMPNLKEVKLQDLTCVTDHGLITLVENALALERLTLTKCPNISRTCIAYVKRRVKQVVERDEVDYED